MKRSNRIYVLLVMGMFVCMSLFAAIPLGEFSRSDGSYDTGPSEDTIVSLEDNSIINQNPGATQTGQADPEGSFLKILLTDAPLDDVQSVIVQFDTIDVHSESAGWVLFSETSMEIDLLELQDGLVATLGLEELEPGAYNQIRLTLGSARATINNETENVTVPSGEQTGIKLISEFVIEPGKVTTLLLDWDVEQSLHSAPGRGYILRPTIEVIASTVEPVVKIDPDQLVSLQNLESASLVPMQIRFGDTFAVPEFFSGRWETNPSLTDAGAKAVAFLKTYGDLFRIEGPTDSFVVVSTDDSPLGYTNVRLQQTHEGVPVWGAEQIIHIGKEMVLYYHGTVVPDMEVLIYTPVSASQAQTIAEADLMSRFGGVQILWSDTPLLSIYNPAVFDRFIEGEDTSAWFLVIQTDEPGGTWNYFVDSVNGDILDLWDQAAQSHPSKVFDALSTNPTFDDSLWFQDHVQMRVGTPPTDVQNLNNFGSNYYNYLLNTFGIDSINDNGMRLVARANDIGQTNNACFDCRWGEASFGTTWTTMDIVAHEFTHGLVRKLGGNLVYKRQSGALNEANADIFGEYLDCNLGTCNWIAGTDAFNTFPTRNVRDLSNPPGSGLIDGLADPDHMDNYIYFAGRCRGTGPLANDNCGVHSNSGIPNKIAYLIAQGDTHYGYTIQALGLAKAEQLVFSTLIDSGLTRTATFYEYRDVMLQTCGAMVGGPTGMTSSDCRQVHKAWSSVGLGFITQTMVRAVNEDNDYFGRSLASGDFNCDGYADLAVGTPYEDVNGMNDVGVVFVFYGTSIGLDPTGTEILVQSDAGNPNEVGDKFGWSLAVGNFDGGSCDDLAVGVPYENFGSQVDIGSVIVFYGFATGLKTSGGTAVWELLEQSQIGLGIEEHDRFGYSLVAGDFDGDSFDDLAVGVPYEHIGSTNDAGIVNVFFGSTSGLLVSGVASYQNIDQEDAGEQSETNDRFGWALASGDFNLDGWDDLAIGVPYEDVEQPGLWTDKTSAGVVNIFYGNVAGFILNNNPSWWDRINQGMYSGDDLKDDDRFGYSLAVGDFDDDSYDDLAVGSPYEKFDGKADTGVVTIFYGAGGGITVGGSTEILSQDDAGANVESNDRFGWSLTVGRFNGDSYDDLAVGVPKEDWAGKTNNGVTMVLWGSNTGLSSTTGYWFGQSSVGGVEDGGDRFGFALAAGDFDDSGKDDLAVGAPYEDFPGGVNNAGAVYINEY